MREWFIVIISLLIVGILLDGLRRKRLHRRDNLRMSRSVYKKSQATASDSAKTDPVKDSYTSELPNGGARVVGYRDPSAAPQVHKRTSSNNRRIPEQARLNLDESVPLLMESVSEDVLLKQRKETPRANSSAKEPVARQGYQRLSEGERIEPTLSAMTDDPAISAAVDDIYDSESNRPATNSRVEVHEVDLEELDTDDDLHTDDVIDDYDEDEDDYQDDVDADAEDDRYSEDDDDYDSEDDYVDEDDESYYDEQDDDGYDDEREASAVASSSASQPQKDPEEVLIINIMAHKGEMLSGSALLDVVLECGMRFGDMDIFHRYTDAKGEGALLFSMANMVKPGTFDLDAMEQFETPGVSLFMTLPLDADSMQSFELMVETARRIADSLYGELKDEQRSVMTRQTIEHCRQRIRDYELKKLSRARH